MPPTKAGAPSSSTASPSSGPPSTSTSVLIKGGGRATLSDANAEAIVDLLRSVRDSDDPLRPKGRRTTVPRKSKSRRGMHVLVRPNGNGEGSDDEGGSTSSAAAAAAGQDGEKEPPPSPRINIDTDHELRRERRRFVRRLVERHERAALTNRVNGPLALQQAASDGGGESLALEGSGSAKAADVPVAASTVTAAGHVGGKVRIVLVEAIYKTSKDKDKKTKKDKKDDSKKKKKKDKSEKARPWKEGQTRKTLALPRSTTARDLLQQAKSKVGMKKKPVRCFYVDGKTGMEVDLVSNLAGLEDGAVVYATCTSHVEAADVDGGRRGGATSSDEGNAADADDACAATGAAAAADEAMDLLVSDLDPLEAVKRAYAERKMRKSRRRKSRARNKRGGDDSKVATSASSSGISRSGSPPTFADHLDRLEALPPYRAELPAASYRIEVLLSLDASRVVVICGATGCGKSTQIPQTILEGMSAAGRADDARVIVTQPRRVAAMSLAERVASERNSPPPGEEGSVVGYNVRLSRRVTDGAKIVYCTVGILLRMLVNPSEVVDDELCPTECKADGTAEGDSSQRCKRRPAVPLSTVTHVIIDEVHERDLNTDFALTLLRPVLAENSHIRIVLMSATASPELFVNYFRSPALAIDPIVLSIPGRTFPVTNNWLADCEKFAAARLQGWSNTIDENPRFGRGNVEHLDEAAAVELSPRASSRIDNTFICKLIAAIIKKQKADGKLDPSKAKGSREDGAVLVFLPGKGEIDSLAKVLKDDPVIGNNDLCNVLRLHSTVPPAQQRFVFQRAKAGTIKIVLSTNVAETSVTIPDVSSVIDTGRVKESRFNSSTRIKELVTVWTSRASATQRAGRSGRTGPGVCWKLYTEQFCNEHLPMRTSPEIVRTPLDELVLQCCLLEEQRRDPSKSSAGVTGAMPIKFLRQAPEPPPTQSLLHACEHLLEVGGIEFVASEPDHIFRLTPLGFHLAHLPMDAKVAKCLIIGCVLECIEPSLTIAACLSHSKSIWLPSRAIDEDGREMQKRLVEEGFGGKDWKGGTVKGDLIGAVAAYNMWSAHPREKDRRKVASRYALDHNVLREVHSLRSQFKDSLVDAGFLESRSGCDGSHNDALFTSCCLVAGLYPNVATLMRPKRGRGNLRGGRLTTKDGDVCKASSSSFQSDRLWNASETGRDAYAVFHAKHRTIGVDVKTVGGGQADVYLNEVNFVSRYALLLFAGSIELRDNAIILDGWLKFKVGEKGGKTGAILLLELRKELDNVMTRHIQRGDEMDKEADEECQRVLQVVRKLLEDEAS